MKLKCPKCGTGIQFCGEATIGHDNEIETEYEYYECFNCGWETAHLDWVTKTGIAMTLEDITDEHLVNILKYLQKVAKIKYDSIVAKFYALGQPRGDMAQLTWDEEEHYLLEEQSPYDYLSPTYFKLLKEYEKRNLTGINNITWHLKR